MRKIHSTLRLFFEAGLSIRAIARTLRVSPEVSAKPGAVHVECAVAGGACAYGSPPAFANRNRYFP